ncbi:hypothetical protein [Streptomyces mangrovisoli]|uniref:hypothetical protein n=1 Tax=Streptomyces mangrovisoli TaxID=1428628 RepID=UPI001F0B46CA|nr:hypothetical protein [Streptomyces mangrovisoli]
MGGESGWGGAVEVGCDESGSDGENLLGGNTDVFAHASVRLTTEDAAACVQEARDRIRSPAEEYKANHLLREKHRAVLEWLLSPAGPLHGRAHVHLTDKAFLVVERTVGLLLGDDPSAAAHPAPAAAPIPGAALVLFRDGPRALGPQRWRGFLEAANRLLRVRVNGVPAPAGEAADRTDAFFRLVGEARALARAGTGLAEVLTRIGSARERWEATRVRLLAAPVPMPVLNPLFPAILRTAAHWGAGGRAVSLVHDRQNMLTPDRIAWIEESARREGIALAGFRLVHSRLDARVQVADFLAGIARSIASDALAGRGDPARTTLLRPYVGGSSLWADAPSWSRLGPPTDLTGHVA